MPKEEWGVKRLCPNCGTRFYDLQRDPMTCPACGSEFDLESFTASKGKSPRAEKSKTPAKEAAVLDSDVDDSDDVVLDDEDDDAAADVEIDDELLEDDEEETVDLEEIADVPADDEES